MAFPRRRVDFTEEDDKNLARYLADNTFQNSSLGRLGYKPYQRLMEIVRFLHCQFVYDN